MRRINAEALEPFAGTLLEALGAAPQVAEEVAESLVTANLRGHNSHGIARIPMYAEMIDGGAIDPAATPAVTNESETTANVDGQLLFGQSVGRTAVDVGVEKASESGVAVVGIKDATHLGRIGEWAERATANDLLFGAFVNTQGGAQTVALPGSADRLLSTNPISFGAPTFDALAFDIVLDMATSQVANGKIYERGAAEEELPAEWTVTEDGGSIADPTGFKDSEVAATLPLGGRTSGYKGFGLAVIAELMGSYVGDAIAAGETEPEWFNNAACFVFIDPLRFTTEERIEQRVTAFADRVNSATYRPEIPVGDAAKGDRAMLPGEPEYETTADRRENGIPLPENTIDELNEFAAEVGVDSRLE